MNIFTMFVTRSFNFCYFFILFVTFARWLPHILQRFELLAVGIELDWILKRIVLKDGCHQDAILLRHLLF